MNSTLNISTNSTTCFGLINTLEMYVYSINFLLGLPMHSCVIFLIITGRGSGISSEFFNLNLSVCELSTSLNCLFVVLSCWVTGLTTLVLFLLGLLFTGRPLFQCLICVERYLAVVHPVTFLKFKPLRYRLICCTAVWIISLSSCLACLYVLSTNYINAFRGFLSVQFVLFISVQLFCCVAVLRALKQSGPAERGREREEENNMKRRAFFIILLTTVNMIVVYVPFTAAGFVSMLTEKNIQPLWNLSFICFMLVIFLQPVLYLQRFRKVFSFCSK